MPFFRLSLLLIGVSPLVAHAGLAVTLIPSPLQCPYKPGQVVHFDIYGQISPYLLGGAPASAAINMVRFDFADTNSEISIDLLPTHPGTDQGDISFWNFGGTPVCAGDSAQCGTDYFVDDSLGTDSLVEIAYTGPSSDETRQVILYQNHSSLIGMFEIVYPMNPGTYVVDILNSDEVDTERGAELQAENIHWRASDGEITGGRLSLTPLWCPEPTCLVLLLSATGLVMTKKHRQCR